MKKALNISVTILAISLTAIGGYYGTELVKLMGANMLTIKGVVGCYVFSMAVVGIGWWALMLKIN